MGVVIRRYTYQFNLTYRDIDDVLSVTVNNPYFENIMVRYILLNLTSRTPQEVSLLLFLFYNLLLSILRGGHLLTSVYDQRDYIF